jgi:hypothetical protein
MQRRNYSDCTIRHYFQTVELFAEHLDKLGLEHVRQYEAYLLKTVVNRVAGPRFFLLKIYRRGRSSASFCPIYATGGICLICSAYGSTPSGSIRAKTHSAFERAVSVLSP